MLNGLVVVGELVQLAVERHERDLRDGHKRGLKFSESLAQHAQDFYAVCRHSKGEWAGEAFTPAPWQAWIDWVLFGWVIAAEGIRRFNTGFVTVARKNGKSTDAAKKGLYLMGPDEEPGAEVYTAATKRDQARIVHSEATRMVQASPDLSSIIDVWKDNLSIPSMACKYEPLGKDADTHDGLNPHAVIMDELHAHKTRDQYDVLRTGMGARRQPLMYIITTAGANRTSICYELDNYSQQVVRGVLKDDSWFCYLARPDPEDDWRDMATWKKGNPNMGVSVKIRNLKRDFREAKESLACQNTFRRLRLNQWTQQVDRVIDMDRWNECSGRPEIPENGTCFLGLDLSSKIDLTAGICLHEDPDGLYHVEAQFWMPEESVISKTRRDRVPYDLWVREGYITATPGNVVDQESVRIWVNGRKAAGRYIEQVAYDPWNATKLAVELQDVDGHTTVEVRQGYKSMSEPTKGLIGAVLDRRIRHGGNPVLAWMADNFEVRRDENDNMAPKKGSEISRIDGMVALIMALGRAQLSEGPSPYESRGLLSLG